MEMLGFVALAHRPTTDEVADESIVAWREEGGIEGLQSLLYPFMPHAMVKFQHLHPSRSSGQNKETAPADHHTVH
jgi:hypothetical protein